MQSLTFTVDGVDRSPEYLGIRNVGGIRIERRNQEPDRVSLEFGASVADEPPWDFEEEVKVKVDGALVFTGYAQNPAITGDAGDEGRTLELLGQWWKLDRLMFLNFPPPPWNYTTSEISGRRTMFVDDNGDAMSTKQMMLELLTYARNKGAISGWSGLDTMDADMYPAPEQVVDRSVAECIRSVLRFHLEMAVSFGAGKTLTLRKRNRHVRTYSLGAAPLATVEMRNREDLAPSGVWIRYEDRGSAQSSTGLKTIRGKDSYPEGHATRPDGIGVLFETIQLDPGEPIPAGVARRYYKMFRDYAMVEGTVELLAEDADFTHLPGDTVKINGTIAGHNNLTALVQGVSLTPGLGRTMLKLGMPDYLDLRGYIDILRLRRRRTRDDLDGDKREPVDPPSTPLTCYLDYVDNKAVLRVTAGEVSDGTNARVPTWDSGSTPLDAAVAPYTLIGEGADFDVWLFVEFTPEAYQFSGTDANGNAVTEWLGVGAGDVDAARILFAVASNYRAPEVDPDSGQITSGRFYRKIGHVSWPAGAVQPTITAIHTGNVQVMHVPPARLFFFESNGQ